MKARHNPGHSPLPAPSGRLLIVEEALHSAKGHWFDYVKTITTACREAGDEVMVIAHRRADPQIIEQLDAHPLLARNAWDRTLDSTHSIQRYAVVLLHNWRLYRSVNHVLRTGSNWDCVLVPTILIHHLAAWTLLAHKHRDKKFKRLVLFFVNGQGVYRGPFEKATFPRTPKTVIFRFLIRRLQRLVRSGQVVLAAETEGMAEEYFAFSGVPFRCLPHPVRFHPEPAPPISLRPIPASDRGITFGCYGFARHEKGSDLLQQAILAIRNRWPDLRIRFVVQWLDDFRMPDGTTQARDPALLQDPDVEFVTRPLDANEYHRYLGKTDAMILPYRAGSYYARVSRVAIEAAIVGLPIVYTRHTWMEELVSEFAAGIGFFDEDLEDLISAILKMAANITSFGAKATARRELARQQYSPENFRKWLLGRLPPTISVRTEKSVKSHASPTPIIP